MKHRVRWTCPTCNGVVLGPGRPKSDNLCRYCLRCSERAGRLVRRKAPVLERIRKARADRRARKSRAKEKRRREGQRLIDISIGGVILYPWIRSRNMSPPLGLRAIKTRLRGPIGGTPERPIVHYGDWADSYDAHAQGLVVGAMARPAFLGGDAAYRWLVVRDIAEKVLGVRPRCRSVMGASVEIAHLLRQKAAALILAGDEKLLERVS